MSDSDDTVDDPTVEPGDGESDPAVETAGGESGRAVTADDGQDAETDGGESGRAVTADDGQDAETDGGDTLDPVADEGLGSSTQTGRPESIETPETIDRRGWLLVAAVVVSFVVMPLVVYFIPELHWFIAALGLSQRQAYILFPMLPALVLGLVAVWASFGLRS